MAYSLMAELPPINGLYATFILVLQYVFFGTSKHVSAGTYAIVSLMIASSIKKYSGIYYSSTPFPTTLGNSTENSTFFRLEANASRDFIHDDPVQAKVIMGTMLALISGFFLVRLSCPCLSIISP